MKEKDLILSSLAPHATKQVKSLSENKFVQVKGKVRARFGGEKIDTCLVKVFGSDKAIDEIVPDLSVDNDYVDFAINVSDFSRNP